MLQQKKNSWVNSPPQRAVHVSHKMIIIEFITQASAEESKLGVRSGEGRAHHATDQNDQNPRWGHSILA